MIIRFLVLLLVGVVAGLFGQTGLFGPVSNSLKAGDNAPDIRSDKILNSIGPVSWSPGNLFGQLTVLTIFPDTSHNLDAVSRWNALAEQFAGKPVQFVWITGEDESSLVPWLAEHPLQGWVLHDPKGETGRSYGMELPSAVIVGADRKILGFDAAMVPQPDTVAAALEGRITTTPPKRDMAEFKAFMESRKVLLQAEPYRMARPDDHKPNFPPSDTLHVTPSGKDGENGNYAGPGFWSLNGFTLKKLIAEVYYLNPIRIHLPVSLDNGTRYDFSLVLPEAESKEQMYERFRQGVQDYFHITATREERLLDAYVVAALDRKPPAAKARQEEGLSFSFDTGSVGYQVLEAADGDFFAEPKAVGIAAITSVDVEGTADDFRRTLESVLDRPVVNETHLNGQFEFNVKASETKQNDFLDRLRDQLGLIVTEVQRNVEILAFEPRQ
jgi:uncharacterized protein (TIGR03435 family)